jgi:EpsD family peptidyl-prolyl cis-trans isomerase
LVTVVSSIIGRAPCIAALAVAAALSSGCGKGEKKPAASQVAAQVNSDEITIHQVNAVLARTPELTPEAGARAKKQILERLIDQQLAVQQALRRKLDRSPEVVQALQAARAEILARAFADEIARHQPKPSAEETKKYYAEHPELFAQRRAFVLEEIMVAPVDGGLPGLAEIVSKSRSTQEVVAWLKSKDAKFAQNRGTRTAEQLPLGQLPRLHAMKEGEMQLMDAAGGRLQVVRLVASKTLPIDEASASPRIQQFLFNQRVSEALANEMKEVRGAAKIEYLGEFSADAAKATSAPVVK